MKRLMPRRPLNQDEVEIRVGTKKASKKDDKGRDEEFTETLLLYKTARTDKKVLDEYFGEENWQCSFDEIKGVLFCTISVWDEDKGQWISKSDAGKESNMESEKGEASDAFKRAGFKWGVGIELYDAPNITLFNVPSKFHTYEVTGLGHNEDGTKITYLEVTRTMGGRKEVVFTFGGKKTAAKPVVAETKPVEVPSAPSLHTSDEVWKLILSKLGRDASKSPNDPHNVAVKRKAVDMLKNTFGIASLTNATESEIERAYEEICKADFGPENFIDEDIR